VKLSEGATIVTGGSAGIGAAICGRLLDEGARVISIARRAPEKMHKALAFLQAHFARRAQRRRHPAG
jgi:NAD(P)-dependent dehydrogenase (short-subunit alcohol dehydrogenase family)